MPISVAERRLILARIRQEWACNTPPAETLQLVREVIIRQPSAEAGANEEKMVALSEPAHYPRLH